MHETGKENFRWNSELLEIIMIISTITILVMVFVSPWCIRQGSKWHKLLEHILQQSKLRDLLGVSAALLLEVKSDTATWRVSQPHYVDEPMDQRFQLCESVPFL